MGAAMYIINELAVVIAALIGGAFLVMWVLFFIDRSQRPDVIRRNDPVRQRR